MNIEQVKSETIKILLENLARGNGQCQVKVRKVAIAVAERLGIENVRRIFWIVDETLREHPWVDSEPWTHGYTKGRATKTVQSRVYQVRERTVEDYAAGANVGGWEI